MPRSVTVKKLAGKLGLAVALPKRRNGAKATGDSGLAHAEPLATGLAGERGGSVRRAIWPVGVVAGLIGGLIGLGLLLKLIEAGREREKKHSRVLAGLGLLSRLVEAGRKRYAQHAPA